MSMTQLEFNKLWPSMKAVMAFLGVPPNHLQLISNEDMLAALLRTINDTSPRAHTVRYAFLDGIKQAPAPLYLFIDSSPKRDAVTRLGCHVCLQSYQKQEKLTFESILIGIYDSAGNVYGSAEEGTVIEVHHFNDEPLFHPFTLPCRQNTLVSLGKYDQHLPSDMRLTLNMLRGYQPPPLNHQKTQPTAGSFAVWGLFYVFVAFQHFPLANA